MNVSVIFDWKFIVAIGAALGFVILACKADPASAEKVLTTAVSTGKELVIAEKQD